MAGLSSTFRARNNIRLPRTQPSGKIDAPKLGGKLRQSRIALLLGTRPEAIKLSPVARALEELGEPPALIVTGQHPGLELANHQLECFPATFLDNPGLPDPSLHADLVRTAVKRLLTSNPPQLLMVAGGTSSALGGALAARETGVPIAHLEAGLRTFDPNQPWPEEENRAIIDRLANLLFAPTRMNAANLRRDLVPGQVHVTGSSAMDALTQVVGRLPVRPRRRAPWSRFSMLVTCHRRESWKAGLEGVAEALRILSSNVRISLVLPPNPTVTQRMTELLGGTGNITLIPPLSHAAFIEAMRSVDLVLSDSGGVEEEAPALGVPLLVLRDKTERPEGLANGSSELVGTCAESIIGKVEQLRRNPEMLRAMRRSSLPFGDGRSGPRIARRSLLFVDELATTLQSSIA